MIFQFGNIWCETEMHVFYLEIFKLLFWLCFLLLQENPPVAILHMTSEPEDMPFSLELGVLWGDAFLLSRSGTEGSHKVYTCDEQTNRGWDHGDSYRKILSWHENVVHSKLRAVRDSWHWWYVWFWLLALLHAHYNNDHCIIFYPSKKGIVIMMASSSSSSASSSACHNHSRLQGPQPYFIPIFLVF